MICVNEKLTRPCHLHVFGASPTWALVSKVRKINEESVNLIILYHIITIWLCLLSVSVNIELTCMLSIVHGQDLVYINEQENIQILSEVSGLMHQFHNQA